VVQEGDEELANEDEDVVLVEKEAEEGDLFPRRGGKRPQQDETHGAARPRRVDALPGSNPRCSCAHGGIAKHLLARVAVARVGFVPYQQTTAEHVGLVRVLAKHSQRPETFLLVSRLLRRLREESSGLSRQAAPFPQRPS